LTLYAITQARIPFGMQLEFILRIMIAAFCGACVGLERGRRYKDAGIRTHCMVACSAAVMVIISKYGFADILGATGEYFPGVREADPARIAAQVVSGISFLGVGVIYRDRRNSTKGLTTAAGIWAVAGIGMAIGAGLYYIGLFTTAFVLTLQILMHKSFFLYDRHAIVQRLDVVVEDVPHALDRIAELLQKRCLAVLESHVTRSDEGILRCRYVVSLNATQGNQPITSSIMEMPGVRSVDWGEPAD